LCPEKEFTEQTEEEYKQMRILFSANGLEKLLI
jgi:hypothetical protein